MDKKGLLFVRLINKSYPDIFLKRQIIIAHMMIRNNDRCLKCTNELLRTLSIIFSAMILRTPVLSEKVCMIQTQLMLTKQTVT